SQALRWATGIAADRLAARATSKRSSLLARRRRSMASACAASSSTSRTRTRSVRIALVYGQAVPAAAERANERNRGGEAPVEEVPGVALPGELARLDLHHVEEAYRARPVLVQGELQRQARRLQRVILQLRPLLEDAQRGEVVLHLRDGAERRLAVVGDS